MLHDIENCANDNCVCKRVDQHQHHMISMKVDSQNSSRGIDKSLLLNTGLSGPVNRLSIILRFKSLLSVFKIVKSSKNGRVAAKWEVFLDSS